MTTFDPLLNTEELHTELLKTIDSKLDVLNLKVEELASSTTARMAHLDSRLEATMSALPNFQFGLCGKCLRLAHQGDCGVMCGLCRQGHNSLLCPSKGTPYHMAKKRKA
ncbi:hypothetical protein Aduo_016596 [Ancylostoma duodenale]